MAINEPAKVPAKASAYSGTPSSAAATAGMPAATPMASKAIIEQRPIDPMLSARHSLLNSDARCPGVVATCLSLSLRETEA